MFHLLLSLGLFLANAQTISPIETYTSSSSPSPSVSSSLSASNSPLASSNLSASSGPLPSVSSTPLASNVPSTDIPRTNNTTLGYIMVGCTLGAIVMIGIIIGVHAVVKKRSENKKLVSRVNTANTLIAIHQNQTSVRTLLPSRKILNYRDTSDNRILFPPANHV